MALIKCPICGKEISDKAKVCPNCGLDIIEYNHKLEEARLEAERQERIAEEQKKEEEQKRLKELESKEKCPECGALVDKEVEKCPNCGFPIKEEKERINIELNNTKRKNKKIIIICMSFIILLCICLPFIYAYGNSSEYKKAKDLLENGELYDAKQKFEQLHKYKDSKEMLEAIDVGLEMLPIIRESREGELWFSDDIYIQSIGDIFERSENYEILNPLREQMINSIKSELDYPLSQEYNKYYDDVEYLIGCIEKYTDTKELTSKLKNLQVVELLKNVDENGNYEEVALAINELDEKNDEVQKLCDLYLELYEKYGKFTGEYCTFEFNIVYDWTNLYEEEDEIYFEIINSERRLDNEDKEGDTGCCYSDLSVKGNKMSFLYHDEGSGSKDNKVILKEINGMIQMTINGKKINLDPEPDSEESDDRYNEKEEPYIGMSAYDAEYHCTWGKPTDKNITETEYGKSEQWVYKGYGYLYIEDNEVKTIQK